jgi:hypothetical protein
VQRRTVHPRRIASEIFGRATAGTSALLELGFLGFCKWLLTHCPKINQVPGTNYLLICGHRSKIFKNQDPGYVIFQQ